LLLASFYGYLGERATLSTETERALDSGDFFGWELTFLAVAHARLGETERAVELLRRGLRQGPNLYWEELFEIASVPPLTSDAFSCWTIDAEFRTTSCGISA